VGRWVSDRAENLELPDRANIDQSGMVKACCDRYTLLRIFPLRARYFQPNVRSSRWSSILADLAILMPNAWSGLGSGALTFGQPFRP
jgi:hypothetical protein